MRSRDRTSGKFSRREMVGCFRPEPRPSRIPKGGGPAVAMMKEPPRWLAALEGHDQGVNTQLRLEVIRHRPADDLARRHILEGR